IGTADYSTIFLVIAGIAFSFIAVFVTTMVTNVAISNTKLDGGFALVSNASPWRVGWILITNTLLTILTLGFYYPFARVRLARYRMQKYALIASGDLDAFTSESLENQSAIGEEIAGFFDFSFGL
ncbi:MAG: DUF898 family protein, partial [Alphaproteobacteria bacterium]|nr:DUF898 family protein [Alphaproteobacteria bacterium]